MLLIAIFGTIEIVKSHPGFGVTFDHELDYHPMEVFGPTILHIMCVNLMINRLDDDD